MLKATNHHTLTCHVVLLEEVVVTVEAEDVVVAAAHVDADSPRSGTRSASSDAADAADAAQRGAGGAVRVGRGGGRAAGLSVLHQHRHGDPPRRRLQGEL